MKTGEIIKQYVIEYLIGSGSFGKVYKIHAQNDIKKIYALKEINIQYHASKKYLETAIQREIEIMKKVENENSVKLFDDFEYDDCTYLVLELCDNNLLEEFRNYKKINKKSYNELEVYMIMSQLNNCFKKMNEAKEKIIHRDLKLENILIKYDKKIPIIGFIVKLSDFGLSRKVNPDNIDELAKSNVGTPLTKAPEIFFNKEYTHKVDLWSLGIIMYQLLFKGVVPFQARNEKELKNELKKFESLKLMPEKRKLISDECFDLLNKLLVTNPDKRIDFDEYIRHKFFSEEHKNELIKKYIASLNEIDKNIEVVEIKRLSLKLEEFEEKFLKLRILKKYNGLKIYKGKDKSNNEIVYIKEISRDIIDKNKENKNLFDKEIKLLSLLKGLHFPKCFGLYETKSFYFIIYEYYQGNILEDFIYKRKGLLNESIKKSIILQLGSSFMELKKKNIILKNISSKSLVFSFYQNENNFMIKIFDFYINSIFFKDDDNSVNLKFEEFISDLNDKSKENLENANNFTMNLKPILKDEYLEKLLEIIKNKIEIITDYFQEFFADKNIVEIERISNYYKEIIILLYFCLLECKIIINFLNINADKNVNEINKSAQEVHLLKLYLNEDNKKYEYSNINFLDESKIWYYNKENPSFDYFIKIFYDLKTKLNAILDKYIENNINNFTNAQIIKNNKNDNSNINFEMGIKIIENCIKEGNLENLFSKFFENIIAIYPTIKKSKISKELNIIKYIMEYIIFIKLMFKQDNNNLAKFEKLIESSKDTVSFSTFIGNKIKIYKEKGILNASTYENNDEGKENLLLEKMINFYIKIMRFTN